MVKNNIISFAEIQEKSNKELVDKANSVINTIIAKINCSFAKMREFSEEFELASDLIDAESSRNYELIKQLLQKYEKSINNNSVL